MSLDVLRGFDMFWILGADAVVLALGALLDNPVGHALAGQMEHKVWAGFACYDLIFPLFVFISGVSLVFALPKTLAQLGRGGTIWRNLCCAPQLILLRWVLLYNGGLAGSLARSVRFGSGVLQRIAIAYAVTGVLFCCFRPRTCYAIGAALLVGYWALLHVCPRVRGHRADARGRSGQCWARRSRMRRRCGSFTSRLTRHTMVTGRYERGLNVANHFDYEWLPGAMYQVYWDPEGLLSTLPAIATCLLGMMAGQCLRRTDRTPARESPLAGDRGGGAVRDGRLDLALCNFPW